MDFIKVTLDLLEGFGISLLIFLITLVFSLPLGLLITFGSMSKVKVIKYIMEQLYTFDNLRGGYNGENYG